MQDLTLLRVLTVNLAVHLYLNPRSNFNKAYVCLNLNETMYFDVRSQDNCLFICTESHESFHFFVLSMVCFSSYDKIRLFSLPAEFLSSVPNSDSYSKLSLLVLSNPMSL